MKILLTGSSGLIGQALKTYLSKQGHDIIPLTRHKSHVYWNPQKEEIHIPTNIQIDVVINLAGENIANKRWDKQQKEKILKSRVKGTKLLVNYFSQIENKPKVFISGSAVGFYGDRGDEDLDEKSEKGKGFLSDVCQKWEEATQKASKSGIRVANLRLGMVLSQKGGALKKMLTPFELGLGGVIGSGEQYISWIRINDLVQIIEHIINDETLNGPINVTSPNPVTNYTFTKTLGKVLNRPTILPLPEVLAKIIFGQMAKELLLSSTKAIPNKLINSGYIFKEPTIATSFKKLLKDSNQSL